MKGNNIFLLSHRFYLSSFQKVPPHSRSDSSQINNANHNSFSANVSSSGNSNLCRVDIKTNHNNTTPRTGVHMHKAIRDVGSAHSGTEDGRKTSSDG